MNYLIFGRGANTGDIGIAAAMLQDILEMDPAASFVYLCDRPDAFSELPELRDSTVELFRDISSGRSTKGVSRLSRALEFVTRFLALRWRPSLLFQQEPELRRITEHYAWADVVVRQGGPGWNDWVLKRTILKIRLSYFALARHYDVPMVMYAQSFGPFAWTGVEGLLKRTLTRYMLNGTHLLTLRDRFSRASLERIGVLRPRIVDAADVAWNLRPAPAQEARDRFDKSGVPAEERPWIGLTLRSMHGRYGVPEEREQELVEEFAALCDNVVEEMGTLIFLSTDYRDHGRRNDLDFLRLVQQQMRHGSEIFVIEDDLQPSELKAMYAEMDVLISVRLHPGIFAMASGVPTMLVGYDPKCADVAEQMQMKEWYIDIGEFTADAGMKRLGEMLSRLSELIVTTERHAEGIKIRASRSVDVLEALCKKIHTDNSSGVPAANMHRDDLPSPEGETPVAPIVQE